MKKIILILGILMAVTGLVVATRYEWILGQPVQTTDEYEWILGQPYIIIETAVTTTTSTTTTSTTTSTTTTTTIPYNPISNIINQLRRRR